MKNRFVLLVTLMLVAVLTWTACGKAPAESAETEKPAATEAAKEEETQAPVVSEVPETENNTTQEEAHSERISYPFEEGFVPKFVPMPEKILDAELVHSKADDETAYLFYAPADQDILQAYLKLSAYSGLVSAKRTFSDDTTRYILLQPDSDFIGLVFWDEAEGCLVVSFPADGYIYTDEPLEMLMAYYLQELTLPTENGRNVMPQFYASVGRNPYLQNMMGGLSYWFEDEMCWTEWYNEIDLERLWRYTSDMILCGFDVSYDYYKMDDDGCVQQAMLHFSNGDAEVLVVYDAEDDNATVHYKPGVSYNLISGEDYLRYIP